MIDGLLVNMSKAKHYMKLAMLRVKAIQIKRPFVVQTPYEQETGKAGDYLCEGPLGARWPVSKTRFERDFVEIQNG